MEQIVGTAIVIALAIALGLLAAHFWRAKNVLVRFLGGIVTSALTVLLALVGIVALLGIYRLNAPVGNPAPNLQASATPAQLARAERGARGCAGCHSTKGDLPLDGGATNMLGGLGTLYAPNLTPGGPLKDWTDGEIARAIREGVDKNGRPLLIMPSSAFHNLSDDDVKALVAYLRTQPAVQHDPPPRSIGMLGTLLIGLGLFPTAAQPPLSAPVTAPPAGITAAYGQYLVAINGCSECHGRDLAGGRPGAGPPPGPNLTLIVPTWTEDDFVRTIRTGVDPQGHSLRPELMPWKDISAATTDDELKAIYLYLHGLTPIQR